MTPETLKLYEKLQKLFREKMGPIQIGDRIFDVRDNMSGFVIAIDGNRLDYVIDDGSVYWVSIDILRLPLPIDPVNPERGLWGMVDWLMGLTYNGTLYNCIAWRNNKEEWGEGNTPTEALLRALIEQELMI